MNPARRRPGLHSVRARLLVWNVGVVALALAAMGALVSYTVRAKLLASVDRDLSERAARVGPPPPGFGPGGEPESPMGGGAGPRDPRDGADPFAPRPDFPPPGGGQQPRLPREADGTVSVRVPRIFNLRGEGRPPFRGVVLWDAEAFAESSRGAILLRTIVVDGEPARLLSQPEWPRNGLPPPPDAPPPAASRPGPGDRPIGVVQTLYPLAELNRSVDELNGSLLALIPVALLIAGIGGAWLTDRALRPVRGITQAAARIGADDLRRRLPLTGGDEFAELSGTINGMLERLQSAFEHMADLVERQRRFTADASHELKTPLTVIKANSSLSLATRPDRDGYDEAMREIDRSADAMSCLVGDLLLLARADESRAGRGRVEIPAAELLQRVRERCLRPGSAAIACRAGADTTLCANSAEMERVLLNLVRNALRYTPPEGQVTLTAALEGSDVCIEVADTGIGLAAEHLPHLCERFYRVDAARARAEGGSGLGLAICKSLVKANGGQLRIASRLGRGTTVTVTLPQM
jgi:signal transduction histidine kinase